MCIGNGSKEFLACGQRQLNPLALGDVFDDTVHPDGVSGGIELQLADTVEPAFLAVVDAQDAVLPIEVLFLSSTSMRK